MATKKQQLTQLFDGLDTQGRDSLLDYAQFLTSKLAQRDTETEQHIKHQPKHQPRPAEESVLGAVKRLRASYFMIDTDNMINDTSSLVSQFMLQGRPAEEVIDDLEKLFNDNYQKYLES